MSIVNPHPGARQACAPGFRNPPDRQIVFPFAPLPLVAIQARKAGAINDRAATLLAFLLNRRKPGSWAWASNAFIARELGCSVDTIRRAGQALVRAGLLGRHQVPVPDPDDKANRTGWRWDFAPLANATPPSMHPQQFRIGAPLAFLPFNQESREKEKSIDRSSLEGMKTAENTPGVIDKARDIAIEHSQRAFADVLTASQARVGVQARENEPAFLAAVLATATRIPGTLKTKPIADPMGYLFRTFQGFKANGIPDHPESRANAKKLKSQPVAPLVTLPVKPAQAEPRPSSDVIWAWRKRPAPSKAVPTP